MIDIVMLNSLGCEIGRFEVECDELGEPLMLATLASNVDVRSALETMQPGDVLKMEEHS